MKKIVLVFVSLLMIFCLASCNRDEPSNIVNNNVSSVEVSEPFVSVSVTKDANGNILQHILFNKHTKVTYIYDYEWVYDYGAYVCSGSWLTVIDAEGNEVPDEPQISVNGCTCTGNSGDAYNDIYPGYRVPECNCNEKTEKDENINDDSNTINPCVIFNEYGIKITIVSGYIDELFEDLVYNVKIENINNFEVDVTSSKECLNDMLMEDEFTIYEVLPANTSTICKLRFDNNDLKTFGIDTLEKMSMVVTISNPEDMFDIYHTGSISIEFE